MNPLDSYSKYLEYPEIREYLDRTVDEAWVDKVIEAKNIVRRGREMKDQIDILGDDGVPMSYHVSFWKSEMIDFAFLQQDAFDAVDALCPMDRQKELLNTILDICRREFDFEDYQQCREYFKKLINALRQMNYCVWGTEEFKENKQQLLNLLEDNGK